jgi:hypothetical protein
MEVRVATTINGVKAVIFFTPIRFTKEHSRTGLVRWCLLCFFLYLCDFVAALHLQMCKCTNIFSRLFFVPPDDVPQCPPPSSSSSMLPLTGGDGPPPPPAARRVSKLLLKYHRAYKKAPPYESPCKHVGGGRHSCQAREGVPGGFGFVCVASAQDPPSLP